MERALKRNHEETRDVSDKTMDAYARARGQSTARARRQSTENSSRIPLTLPSLMEMQRPPISDKPARARLRADIARERLNRYNATGTLSGPQTRRLGLPDFQDAAKKRKQRVDKLISTPAGDTRAFKNLQTSSRIPLTLPKLMEASLSKLRRAAKSKNRKPGVAARLADKEARSEERLRDAIDNSNAAANQRGEQ